MVDFKDLTHQFGYDYANNVEHFFEKVLSWQNEDKPSETTVNMAKKLVEMIQETPLSLSIFEKKIIISYKNRKYINEFEVDGNLCEFCSYPT